MRDIVNELCLGCGEHYQDCVCEEEDYGICGLCGEDKEQCACAMECFFGEEYQSSLERRSDERAENQRLDHQSAQVINAR